MSSYARDSMGWMGRPELGPKRKHRVQRHKCVRTCVKLDGSAGGKKGLVGAINCAGLQHRGSPKPTEQPRDTVKGMQDGCVTK